MTRMIQQIEKCRKVIVNYFVRSFLVIQTYSTHCSCSAQVCAIGFVFGHQTSLEVVLKWRVAEFVFTKMQLSSFALCRSLFVLRKGLKSHLSTLCRWGPCKNVWSEPRVLVFPILAEKLSLNSKYNLTLCVFFQFVLYILSFHTSIVLI